MGDLVLTWAAHHQQYFLGLATGYAVAHIPEAVCYAFHLAMRVPWLRAAIVADPAKAKSIIKAIETELEKDIDAEAAQAKLAAETAKVDPAGK